MLCQSAKTRVEIPMAILLDEGCPTKSMCGRQQDAHMGKGSGDEFSTSIPPSIRPQSLYALFLMSAGRWIRYVRPFVQIIFIKGVDRERKRWEEVICTYPRNLLAMDSTKELKQNWK